jgi:hypothetical protein
MLLREVDDFQVKDGTAARIPRHKTADVHPNIHSRRTFGLISGATGSMNLVDLTGIIVSKFPFL